MVKRGVETGYLGQVGKTVMKCLGQQYLLRQMLRVEWLQAVKFRNHFGIDSLWLAIPWSAMHYTMADGSQLIAPLVNPIHQDARRGGVVGHRN
jgi:hypothetical protein